MRTRNVEDSERQARGPDEVRRKTPLTSVDVIRTLHAKLHQADLHVDVCSWTG